MRAKGGNGTAGLRVLADEGATLRPTKPGPLDLITPPPNFANASSIDDNSILDPKVGVPHRELALSIISIRSSSALAVAWVGPGCLLVASKNADPLPALALFCKGMGTGIAIICPNSDPGALVTFTTFHPADSASATISRRVLSWALNMTCIWMFW